MARIKVAVTAHKKRRKIMKLAKGYYGSKSKQYRAAKEQVMRSLRYAYIGRKLRKRDFRQLCIARINAAKAGVEKLIHFQTRPIADLSHRKKYGFIITNPPYGERLSDKEELPEIYTSLGNVYSNLKDWSLYVITSYEDTNRYIGRKADKNRKIYNGMIKTYYYQYMGAKPPRKRSNNPK